MNFFNLFISNLLTIPIFAFLIGILISIVTAKSFFNEKISSWITLFLLFSIGLKGGLSLVEYSNLGILPVFGLLIIWGLIQPFISYLILRKFTRIDAATATAVASCFGSISVMTYIAGTTFLEKLNVDFEGWVVAALAIMEVPAIISGLFISKSCYGKASLKRNLLKEAFFNKTILVIFGGMVLGIISSVLNWSPLSQTILFCFKPILSLFLLNMGMVVGKQRENLRQFSYSLGLFGFYMPLIGGAVGISISYFLGLSVGTATLIAILTASASYIAAPAAMRIALPEAKEAIYLPLSLGIAFPFNVMIGIPIYYLIAAYVLS